MCKRGHFLVKRNITQASERAGSTKGVSIVAHLCVLLFFCFQIGIYPLVSVCFLFHVCVCLCVFVNSCVGISGSKPMGVVFDQNVSLLYQLYRN